MTVHSVCLRPLAPSLSLSLPLSPSLCTRALSVREHVTGASAQHMLCQGGGAALRSTARPRRVVYCPVTRTVYCYLCPSSQPVQPPLAHEREIGVRVRKPFPIGACDSEDASVTAEVQRYRPLVAAIGVPQPFFLHSVHCDVPHTRRVRVRWSKLDERICFRLSFLFMRFSWSLKRPRSTHKCGSEIQRQSLD